MFVDINRDHITGAQAVRVVEAAIDSVDLRLNRGLFRGSHHLARTEGARVSNRTLIAFLSDRARAALVQTRGYGLRPGLCGDSKSTTQQCDYRQANDLFCHCIPHSDLYLPPRPNRTILKVSNIMIGSSSSDWFLM